ncbi:unnamed protein product [Gongylonema pulchrum]|uniref:Uncharacterized protein n=1 Tax=Gongylonema pulchrum TaxID=637853 RepID=A0A183DUS8_9BILA|nr:unnamed protein product [Gongylonema pulchrum]
MLNGLLYPDGYRRFLIQAFSYLQNDLGEFYYHMLEPAIESINIKEFSVVDKQNHVEGSPHYDESAGQHHRTAPDEMPKETRYIISSGRASIRKPGRESFKQRINNSFAILLEDEQLKNDASAALDRANKEYWVNLYITIYNFLVENSQNERETKLEYAENITDSEIYKNDPLAIYTNTAKGPKG